MASVSIARKTWLALLLAGALMVAGAIALAPSKAFAGELATGKQSSELSTMGYKVVSNPAAPKIDICISTGPGTLAVHASKVESAQGYEFQIARNASFTKGVKKKKVKAYGFVFKKLAKGKKYYVRARAYQNSPNQVCTKWSSKKSAKTGMAYKRTKFVGTWRAVSSNNSEANANMKYAWSKYRQYTAMVIKKNGTMYIRGYDGKKAGSTFYWVAPGKKSGYQIKPDYTKGSLIKIVGNKLVVSTPSSNSKIICVRA